VHQEGVHSVPGAIRVGGRKVRVGVSVVVAESWPRATSTAFTEHPAEISADANVWRRS
jgi:hypothetical protein